MEEQWSCYPHCCGVWAICWIWFCDICGHVCDGWFVVLQRSSSLNFGEKICAFFIPFVAIIEVLFFTLADCFTFRPHPPRCSYKSKDLKPLADETECIALCLHSYFIICFEKHQWNCIARNGSKGMGTWGKHPLCFKILWKLPVKVLCKIEN